ncbi:MAG TPA: hypothetical protein VLK58_08140 [Conexibacter sp.]|nr:hypothetical protein [Conexibacter sp.]
MIRDRIEAPTGGWAERYDRAAGELLDDRVVAAAQFMRPRGWKAFGHALSDRPVSLVQRARGRPRSMRLPQVVLVAVTGERVHLLEARAEPGQGPVPHPTGTLAAWERAAIDVDAAPVDGGTRLTIAPEGGPTVELYGPPDVLTMRVVAALADTG